MEEVGDKLRIRVHKNVTENFPKDERLDRTVQLRPVFIFPAIIVSHKILIESAFNLFTIYEYYQSNYVDMFFL